MRTQSSATSTQWSWLMMVWMLTVVGRSIEGAGVPHSKVQTLTASNFHTALADPANGLWLLKFYAPWCSHCKRLAPVLDAVAPQVEGMMAIGKIDCTKTSEKALCKKYGVKGYPTLKVAIDGSDMLVDYPLPRKAEALIGFARKMSQPPIKIVRSYEEALNVAVNDNDDGIAFVGYHPDYIIPDGATDVQFDMRKDDLLLAQVFGQAARKSQAFAHFCWYVPPNNGHPDISAFLGDATKTVRDFVVKIEADVPPISWQPKIGLTLNELTAFVKENNVPVLVPLGPHNFHKIGHTGRPLVIGAVDAENEAQTQAIKDELKAYATTTGPRSIVNQYYFAWIDGRSWQHFLEQFEVSIKGLPTIFVLNVPLKRYWRGIPQTDGDADGDEYPYESLSVAELLDAIDNGTIPMRLANQEGKGMKGMLKKLEVRFLQYLPWSLVIPILIIIAFLVYILPPPGELRPPYDGNTEPPAPMTKIEKPSESNDVKEEEAAPDDDEPKKEK